MTKQMVRRGSLILVLLILLSTLAIQSTPARGSLTLYPDFSKSSTTATISMPALVAQMSLTKPNFLIYSPGDAEQQFRLEVSLQSLMETTALNQTGNPQVLDSLDLQALSWDLSVLQNATVSGFGRVLGLSLTSIGDVTRNGTSSHVNVTLTVFLSEYHSGAWILTPNWSAEVFMGGPAEMKMNTIIGGWQFRAPSDMLALRVRIDDELGTVNHHEEFSQTQLYTTIGVINDVTSRGDGYVQWLRKAVVQSGSSRESVDVDFRTFNLGGAIDVDLFYPSFLNGTLDHDPAVGIMPGFLSAPLIPLSMLAVAFAGVSLLVITLVVAYFSRRSRMALRRGW